MTTRWPEVPLLEICNPKQWPTVTAAQMTVQGFPVYGANGKIGHYGEFNHAEPTILIGCRGSCGAVTVSEKNSYVTGNAMALDSLNTEQVDLRYLYRVLQWTDLSKAITGTSQPQITRTSLKGITIPVPPIDEQRRIAAIIDKADDVRTNRRLALASLNTLAVAHFVEMFGDPTASMSPFPIMTLGSIGEVITGNTPSRQRPEFFGDDMEWIKSDNIQPPDPYLSRSKEGLSIEGLKVARVAPTGSILVTCIAGSPASIGNAAIADRPVAFNQQINALVPHEGHPFYFHALLVAGKRIVQSASTASMKGMISKSKFSEIRLPVAPVRLQENFADVAESIYMQRSHNQDSARELDDLFASLEQRAFQGAL